MRGFAGLASLCSLSLFLGACSAKAPGGALNGSDPSMNVFGADQRHDLNQTSYPHSAIGKLEVDRGNWFGECTATLVWYDLILTASHCIHDEQGNLTDSKASFYPNFPNLNSRSRRVSSKVVAVWSGTPDPHGVRSQDWAILQIADPLGKKYGFMPIKPLTGDQLPAFEGKMILAGYSSDYHDGRVAGIQRGCSLFAIEGSTLVHHDCDMHAGASGGPVFRDDGDDYAIAAINVAEALRPDGSAVPDGGEYSEATANFAVDASQAMEAFRVMSGRSRYQRP